MDWPGPNRLINGTKVNVQSVVGSKFIDHFTTQLIGMSIWKRFNSV